MSFCILIREGHIMMKVIIFRGKGIIQERHFTVIGGGQWGPAGKRIVPAQWAGAVGKTSGQATSVKKLREIHLEP